MERRVEFAGEGLDYKDVIRFGTAEIDMKEDSVDKDGNVIAKQSLAL
ncbi:RagB/SusD family nutrient uptake outer membrane protein [Arenibacter sp. M-2]|nr:MULTISPECIES: RagB/SusD family nutrient uptake outer membrane protein [unclassified Arenibacter]MDL5512667.1 RagB/SusD family nutrient uptake outer membrane protein [Arenibacter sp. M-2]